MGDGAGSSGLGMTQQPGAFGTMVKKSIHQTALSQYLQSQGATRDEIKSINDSILGLIEMAKDKQEEMGDRETGRKILSEQEMIAALKKVEIKF